ncbi:MAG: thiolase family protein [Chloroflexi bacterium]|nr:thiolase family protein [Chloroflexota bacterium]MCH8094074.1 thiolase family protein [Chloroflexota bacterium]MCH8337518.1 thiolase family protein [Chloroflexota bacterium]MCH8340874.1 thiolase family protein [Chloroflexota bacterium]MCI0772342.1 thiolase family protein [Chloroflexota bacterium]
MILSAVRTPIGRFQGEVGKLSATHLGAAVVREAVLRSKLEEPEQIDEVLMGNVVSAGLGQAPARQVAIEAGLPPTVGATTVNKVCGSGLKAGMLAAQAIKAGDADIIVAGGMENMSRAPYLVRGRGGELRYGHESLEDALLLDGLWDPFENWAMGMAAEYIADEYEVTREAMDRWALDSHQKAVAAASDGKFKAEIVPLEIFDGKHGPKIVTDDETPRRDTSLEKLAALEPAYKDDGRVTAGNAPGLNDGAAALVYASRARAEQLGLTPMARVVGYTQAAVPPREMFIAPAQAIPKLLARVGWTPEDVDLIELNEAFAAQVLADGYAMSSDGWDWDKVNVNGGAIALGHPLGASGARVLTTLLYALKDRGLSKGIASLCLGGGEAVAMAVELI